MHVADVRPGMKGYGLTVFNGSKIERFDVETVSVLHNFNPKYDVVLIRCHGSNIEHVGAVAGMSGSPIYLYDAAGRARLLGAFAYGWPLSKDPIAGVQPIEYMLSMAPPPRTNPADSEQGQDVHQTVKPLDHPGAVGRSTYPFTDALRPRKQTAGRGGAFDQTMRPLSTPLMASGFAAESLDALAPLLHDAGLVAVQSGGSGTLAGANADSDPPIEPGSALSVPLLLGDADLSAVGTCTAVIGDRVLAFGHPFNGEGPIALPMASATIQGVIASYMSSFKLGSTARVRGTLTDDRTVGVAGTLGAAPAMMPIDLRVQYLDGSQDQTYHFQAARHAKLTPLAASAAVTAALGGVRELPENHTTDYDFTIEFDNGRRLHVVNSLADAAAGDVFMEIGLPLLAASENPFQRVLAKRITGTVLVSSVSRSAEILYASVSRTRFRPGATVTAFVVYRPFHDVEHTLPVKFKLPANLPEGTYDLSVSDWQQYLRDEQDAEPFKFSADSVNEVFDVLRDVATIRHDALYVRLQRQPDGVAVGRTAMPKLPDSRRELLIGSDRSDITQFVSSDVTVVKTDDVMSGSAQFAIDIDNGTDAPASSGAGIRSGRPAARHDGRDVTPHAAAPPDKPVPPGHSP